MLVCCVEKKKKKKGTSIEQDSRFSDKNKKQLQAIKFPEDLLAFKVCFNRGWKKERKKTDKERKKKPR